jgi:hypothetical protein
MMMFVIVVCMPWTIVAAIVATQSDVLFRLNCRGCYRLPVTSTVIIVESVSLLLVGFLVYFRIRRLKDPWAMRSEARNTLMWILITFAMYLLGQSGLATMRSGADLSLGILIVFIMAVNQMTIVELVLGRRDAILRNGGSAAVKHGSQQGGGNSLSAPRSPKSPTKSSDKRISKLAHGQVHSHGSSSSGGGLAGELLPNSPADASVAPHLDMILRRPAVAEMFENHLVSELGIESMNFLVDSSDWKTDFFDVAPTARLARARRIVKSYIETNGMMTINIPWAMADKLKREVLPVNENELKQVVFDDARREISTLLEMGAVKRFVDTKEYRELEAGEALIIAVST